MNSLVMFLNDIDFRKRLFELEKQNKDKKILLYGTGAFCDAIFDNFDLSKLNIIAVSDKKYIDNSQFYRGIKAIPPSEIEDCNPDIILITIQYSGLVETFFKDVLFYKNTKIKYVPIIQFKTPPNKYDVIFSLGEACHCASALRLYGLRDFSGPFDWIFGAAFDERIDMLLNRFEDFLNIEDIEKIETDSFAQEFYDIYKNTKTSVTFNHDFAANQSFEETFFEVKKKYDRRINRLLNYLDSDKNVLIVFMTHPSYLTSHKSDFELLAASKKLNENFNANIHILYMLHNNDFENKECSVKELSKNVFKAELFNLPKTENDLAIDNFKNMRQVFKNLDII